MTTSSQRGGATGSSYDHPPGHQDDTEREREPQPSEQECDTATAGLSPALTRYGTPPYGLIPPLVIPCYLLVNVLDTVN